MKTDNIDRPAILAEMNAAFYRYEQALITNDTGTSLTSAWPLAIHVSCQAPQRQPWRARQAAELRLRFPRRMWDAS